MTFQDKALLGALPAPGPLHPLCAHPTAQEGNPAERERPASRSQGAGVCWTQRTVPLVRTS